MSFGIASGAARDRAEELPSAAVAGVKRDFGAQSADPRARFGAR